MHDYLVRGRRGRRSSCEADLVVTAVVDRVEALTKGQLVSFIPNKVT